MTDPVTAQPTRDQLRALADAATPGPWEADHAEEDNSSVKERGREWWDGLAFAGRPADAAFIAASRTAIPQLLDQLDQAEHRIARLEAQTGIRGRAVVMYRERAREAEQREWQGEAIIRRQERYIEDLESVDVVGLKARAQRAEARVEAVEDVLDAYAYTGIYTGQERVAVSDIRRALDT